MIKNKIFISDIQKRMFFLAFVTAFTAALVQNTAVLVDNILVCRFYGDTDIAAMSLANPVFYAMEIPAAGLAAGIQLVCAKELGAGEIDKVVRIFNQIFFFAAAVMAVLTILTFLYAPELSVLLGARGKTADLQLPATQFLYGISFDILPYVLFCVTMPIVILDNGGKLVAFAAVCGGVCDIIVDLLSIRFGWGLLGIGAATSISAVVYFLITALHFLKRDKIIQLRPTWIRFGEVKGVFVAAVPKVSLFMASMIRSFLLILIVSVTGGVVGTCVLAIDVTIDNFIIIGAEGIAGAVAVMGGICYGEKNGEELEGTVIMTLRYSIGLSVLMALALFLSAGKLAGALTENRASTELLIFAIYCRCASVPFSVLVRARISYLEGVERVRAAQWMGIASDLFIPLVAAFLLVIPFGVRGVFLAFPVGYMGSLLISWILHVRRTGKRMPALRDYLEIDDSFYIRPVDVISYPVKTERDCVLASKQTMLFCRAHKLDQRKCMLARLCVEELATNAIRHGIKPRAMIDSADIRVIVDGEYVLIRLRDGGPAFNLKQFAVRLEEQGDPRKGTGIRLMLHSATSVSYYRTYGMNTTIIRV